MCSSSDRSRGKISVGTIGIVENGFGISILPFMDIVRLHLHCNPGADLKLEIKILHCKKKIRHPHRAGRGVFSALEEVMKFYGIQKTFVVRRKNRYNKVVSYMRKQEKI